MVDKKNQSILDQLKYPVVVGVGAFILSIVLIYAVGKPVWANFQKVKDELRIKREVQAKLDDKLTNLKALKENEEDLKKKNAKILAALPTDTDVARLFVQFEQIGSENGLVISSVQEAGAGTTAAAVATPSGTIRKVTYNLTGSALNYDSFKKSLAKSEEALRILSISAIDASSKKGPIDVNLKITTFVRGATE